MFAVIKIGGCNGSGKTTLMRAVMDHLGSPRALPELRPGKPEGYTTEYSTVTFTVLGSYETVCGGMDTISDKDVRFGLVKKYAKPGRIVMFEGLITGKTYGALGALSEQHVRAKRGAWLYAAMDTPFDVCTARVLQRRAAKGNANPFDPERTMRPTFKSVHSTMRRAAAQGHPIYWINHKHKPATAAKRLVNRALELYRENA